MYFTVKQVEAQSYSEGVRKGAQFSWSVVVERAELSITISLVLSHRILGDPSVSMMKPHGKGGCSL